MKKIAALALLLTGSLLSAAVQTVQSQAKEIKVSKEYVGAIYSHKETMIATRMMGYIKSINVEEGDLVKAGDILFEVDPSDIESAKSQAEAGVLSAKAMYLDAKRDYDRFEDLYAKGVVPKRDFEKMQLNLELREQGLKMAEAQLGQVKAQMQYTTVTSPIDGIVIHKMSKVAEIAAPGRPVLILSSLSDLRAKALVKESDIGKVHVGMPITVSVPSLNRTIDSKITSVVPSGDPATHSYAIKANLKQTDGLLPGMYVKLAIDLESRNGITVPLSAVTERGGIRGVFTLEGEIAKFVPVEVLSQQGSLAEVSGLAAGKTVIVQPGTQVRDGEKAR